MNDTDKESEIRYTVELSRGNIKYMSRMHHEKESDQNIVFEGKLHQLCEKNKDSEVRRVQTF